MRKREGEARVSQRQLRVGAAIHRALGELLRRSGGRFSLNVTISEVRASPDLRHARIYVQARTEERELVMGALEEERRKFQKLLGRQLRLKFTPILSFHADLSLERAEALEKIFQSEKVAADLAADEKSTLEGTASDEAEKDGPEKT